VSCPQCGRTAPFHSHKPKTFLTLLGPVRLHRAYYRCGCGGSRFLFDESATLTGRSLSLAVEELASLAGVCDDSFAEAAEVLLRKLAGLRLSESTVERTTEDSGALVGAELAEGCTYGQAKDFDWQFDKLGRTTAYFGIDGTGVPQQGCQGAKAEGKMPYVALVFNPLPQPAESVPPALRPAATLTAPTAPAGSAAKPKEMQARYLAGLYSLPLLGLLLRKQAAQVGMERAAVWIGLSDGGAGLEDFLRTNFNRAEVVVILDFYHPASRLEELAKWWHEGDAAKAKHEAQQWCQQLKHEGGPALLERLRSLPPPKRPAAQEKYRELLGYLENHQHKMNYPHYLQQGWYIGSGAVESACKTVVGQRLKQAGMRWGTEGTDSVCHLRALFKSEPSQWDAFWARCVNKGSISYQPK
jgi:hypothetical protein